MTSPQQAGNLLDMVPANRCVDYAGEHVWWRSCHVGLAL